jgi:hypothetical protein
LIFKPVLKGTNSIKILQLEVVRILKKRSWWSFSMFKVRIKNVFMFLITRPSKLIAVVTRQIIANREHLPYREVLPTNWVLFSDCQKKCPKNLTDMEVKHYRHMCRHSTVHMVTRKCLASVCKVTFEIEKIDIWILLYFSLCFFIYSLIFLVILLVKSTVLGVPFC